MSVSASPKGRNGAEDGCVEKITLNGKEIEGGTPLQLTRGDTITLELPGGGGFGPGLDFWPGRIANDRANELI